MSARHGIALAPTNEKQISRERPIWFTGSVGDDFDTVGGTVAAFECGGTRVHRHVPANSVGIALGMIGGVEVSHAQARRRPTISFSTLPVMKATLAGRSAS